MADSIDYGQLSDALLGKMNRPASAKDAINTAYDKKLNNYKASLEAEQRLFEQHQANISTLRLSEAQKAQKLAEETARHNTRVQMLESEKAIAEARRVNALKIEEENRYKNASLAGKLEMTAAAKKQADTELKALQGKAQAGLQLTKDEIKRRDELTATVERASARELKLIEAKRLAGERQMSSEERRANRISLRAKHEEADRESQRLYDEDLRGLSVDNMSNAEYTAAVEAAKARKAERDSKATAMYGVKGGGIGGFTDDLVTGFSESKSKPIQGIVKTISGIKNIFGGGGSGFVKLLAKGFVSGTEALFALVGQIAGLVAKGIDQYSKLQTKYYAQINTRLIGLEKVTDEQVGATDFTTLMNHFDDVFGASGYVSQESIAENLSKLVSNGVAYNLEQRTILMELSDRMVSTFNMLDKTLVELTKLQQTDMSIADLAAQSNLTEFLNQYFQDTSYMSGTYSSVASLLLPATSQMNPEDATSFAYNVQKWLGSLYGVGMSSGGVETIAKGIAYLASGDYASLGGSDQLRALFGMSTKGAYSSLLRQGVNAENVDVILNNIVDLLASIGDDTDQVLKNAKAGVFGGFSLADIRAVSNLKSTDIANLRNTSLTWNDSQRQINSLLYRAQENTTVEQRIDNIISNVLLGVGEAFVNDDGQGKDGKKGFFDRIFDVESTILKVFGIEGASKLGVYKIGQALGGTFGEIIQGVTMLTSLDDIVTQFQDAWGTALTDLVDINSVQKFLSGSLLQKKRGTSYALTKGVTTGITESALTMLGNKGTGSVGIGSGDDFESQAKAVESVARTMSEATYELSDLINTIYKSFFVDQLPIRVILASVEGQATVDLTTRTYTVTDPGTHDKLDTLRYAYWL